ncbi:MAG TPA: c-type cytochrome, partial [Pyrinomonadaceae bacterium]|nr:c-type cytochrome [Pyrinomonadaceae bacterium]
MKLNILRLLVVMLACASAVIIINRVRAEKYSASGEGVTTSMIPKDAQTPAASAPQEKTAEQVQKNIKVLTGLPQSQLIPVMNYMAASVGRRCDYCHVNNNGQWDYPSDDKQEKTTAREMIKMVLDVNKNTFKGNTNVSCYTCHRGRNSPQSIPSLPLPTPAPRGGNPGGPAPGGASGNGQTPGQPQA